MKQNGLPIPEGVCVTTQAHEYFLKNGEIDRTLISALQSLRLKLGGSVALRSSATCEDGTAISMAGVFETLYLQDESQSIEAALQYIYAQASSPQVHNYLKLHGIDHSEIKMGVVMQYLVQSNQSGVMYTNVNGDNQLVQYVNGFGDSLVDGKSEGSSLLIDVNGKIIQSKGFSNIILSRKNLDLLLSHSQKIKDIFNKNNQDIEFAIENDEVYILQARTLTAEMTHVELSETPQETLEAIQRKLHGLVENEKQALHSDKVIFSDSNFSELLPRPKEMDIGVFAYIFTGSENIPGAIQIGRKQMGYQLGEESVGFMDYIGGKPYFSLAKDAHTFFAGFPETSQEYNDTLVREYLTAIEIDPEKGEYPEMGLYLQDPTFADLRTRFGEDAEKYFEKYQAFKTLMANHAETFLSEFTMQEQKDFEEFIELYKHVNFDVLNNEEIESYTFEVLEHLRTKSCVYFVKTARLGFYYAQRLQSFLRDTFGMSKESAEETFSKLNQGLDRSAITSANLAIAQAENIEQALEVGLQNVGHYSTGEMLEIRHTRLKDDPVALKRYVEGIFNNRTSYLTEFAKQKQERNALELELSDMLRGQEQVDFNRIKQAAQTYMSLRETVKYLFVKEYSFIHDALEVLEDRLGLVEGRIYHVAPREIPSLLQDPETYSTLLNERYTAFLNYPDLDLPSVIRESDIDALQLVKNENGFLMNMIGKLLAQGNTIEDGVIVNIEDQPDVNAIREVIEFLKSQSIPIILVSSQMNLSHDPLIVESDGLIIENAGLVSHGAQRARELGKGAIGGIKAKQLKTGEHVSFNPQTRTVSRIGKNSI